MYVCIFCFVCFLLLGSGYLLTLLRVRTSIHASASPYLHRRLLNCTSMRKPELTRAVQHRAKRQASTDTGCAAPWKVTHSSPDSVGRTARGGPDLLVPPESSVTLVANAALHVRELQGELQGASRSLTDGAPSTWTLPGARAGAAGASSTRPARPRSAVLRLQAVQHCGLGFGCWRAAHVFRR